MLAIALMPLVSLGFSCERSYGIERSVHFTQFPDPACVRSVIERVPGIRGYDEWQWPEEGATGQDPNRAHHFAYDGESVRVQLGVFADEPGRMRFVQSYMRANLPMTRREADEARSLMVAVEKSLVADCGLVELQSSVTERCAGVSCD